MAVLDRIADELHELIESERAGVCESCGRIPGDEAALLEKLAAIVSKSQTHREGLAKLMLAAKFSVPAKDVTAMAGALMDGALGALRGERPELAERVLAAMLASVGAEPAARKVELIV